MNIYEPILNTVKTKSEADQLKDEIEILLQGLFQLQNKSFEEVLKTKVRKNIAESIKNIFASNELSLENNENVKSFLNDLKKELEKLSVLKVTLSFNPTEKTIDKLSSWVSTNIGKGTILDIEEDKSLIGGAVFVYNGKYINLSLKKRMEEVFEEKRGEITSLVA